MSKVYISEIEKYPFYELHNIDEFCDRFGYFKEDIKDKYHPNCQLDDEDIKKIKKCFKEFYEIQDFLRKKYNNGI